MLRTVQIAPLSVDADEPSKELDPFGRQGMARGVPVVPEEAEVCLLGETAGRRELIGYPVRLLTGVVAVLVEARLSLERTQHAPH